MFALFNAIDHACGFLPVAIRLGLYGLFVGIIAMLIYRWTSPQRRLAALKLEMADARRAMQSYTGTDAKQMMRLSLRSIAPALRQLLLVLGPTLIALLPVLLVVLWIEATYSYQLPKGGDVIAVSMQVPGGPGIRWAPPDAIKDVGANGRSMLAWPTAEQSVLLLDAANDKQLLRLPLARPVHKITGPRWWHGVLEGGEPIELPSDSPIADVTFELPPREVTSIGPPWLRTWHTPFMVALTIAALGMKFGLKIH